MGKLKIQKVKGFEELPDNAETLDKLSDEDGVIIFDTDPLVSVDPTLSIVDCEIIVYETASHAKGSGVVVSNGPSGGAVVNTPIFTVRPTEGLVAGDTFTLLEGGKWYHCVYNGTLILAVTMSDIDA